MSDGPDTFVVTSMVISTRIYAEHPDLALTHSINAVEAAAFGVVSDAGTDPHHDVHFFWVEASDFDAVEQALERDHTVAAFELIVTLHNRNIYAIEYSDEAVLLTPIIRQCGGLTLESKSTGKGWLLEVQLQDHDELYALTAYAAENDVRLDVLELHQAEQPTDTLAYDLTEPQIEALCTAYTEGYYDEPRQLSLEELGSQLGISQTAVSGRLRRGSARLIEEFLIEDEE